MTKSVALIITLISIFVCVCPAIFTGFFTVSLFVPGAETSYADGFYDSSGGVPTTSEDEKLMKDTFLGLQIIMPCLTALLLVFPVLVGIVTFFMASRQSTSELPHYTYLPPQ